MQNPQTNKKQIAEYLRKIADSLESRADDEECSAYFECKSNFRPASVCNYELDGDRHGYVVRDSYSTTKLELTIHG